MASVIEEQQTEVSPYNSSGETTSSSTRQGETSKDGSHIILILTVVSLMLWIGGKVANGHSYTPRSPFGLYLGIAGSIMMILAVVGYPLRKRMGFMQRWGAIKHWFRIHMLLGLAGPLCIVFHSAFQIRSLNAGIALTSMGLVVTSGIIGRFIYSKIHLGLYGRRATLKGLQQKLSGHSEQAQPFLTLSPKAQKWVKQFEHYALKIKWPFPECLLYLCGVRVWRKWVELRCRLEFRREYANSSLSLSPKPAVLATDLISTYLKEIQRVAEFKIYERIFGLWHVLHIPLIFILAATGLFHVIAVYMY